MGKGKEPKVGALCLAKDEEKEKKKNNVATDPNPEHTQHKEGEPTRGNGQRTSAHPTPTPKTDTHHTKTAHNVTLGGRDADSRDQAYEVGRP